MKTKTALIATLSILFMAATSNAAVNVEFHKPESFTDIGSDSFPTEKERNHMLESIEDHLVKAVTKTLSDRYIVNVKITNIDLAGEFEPWHSGFNDVRIVKRIYPARLNFEYEIYKHDGTILEAGTQKLVHNDDYISFKYRNDSHPYINQLIDDWAHSLK